MSKGLTDPTRFGPLTTPVSAHTGNINKIQEPNKSASETVINSSRLEILLRFHLSIEIGLSRPCHFFDHVVRLD